MSKGQKIIAGLFMIVLMSATVYGAWALIYNPTATGLTVSSEDVSFTDNFGMMAVNSSSSTISNSDVITITNPNGERTATVTWVTTSIDVNDSCDFSSDFTFEADYEGSALTSGDSIDIVAGESYVNTNSTIVPYACPAEYSTALTISE